MVTCSGVRYFFLSSDFAISVLIISLTVFILPSIVFWLFEISDCKVLFKSLCSSFKSDFASFVTLFPLLQDPAKAMMATIIVTVPVIMVVIISAFTFPVLHNGMQNPYIIVIKHGAKYIKGFRCFNYITSDLSNCAVLLK